MQYLGVDVSKDTLEVADVSGKLRCSFHNTGAAIEELLLWSSQHFPKGDLHLVLEPTSTYHHLLVKALASKGVPYTLINPSHTAAFSPLQGRRAKTDRVDAHLLASLGESLHPKPSPPLEEEQEKLKVLSRHVEWLEKEMQGASNRLETARFSPWTPQAVLDSLEPTIQQLEEEAKKVREEMAAHQQEQPEWNAQVKLLTSIPGIGERTAVLLLSEMPQVANCSNAKSWVAFCGLNPEPRESGKAHYSRLSRVGTARVRAGLYLPAVSALRWNPAVKALGKRLGEKGKLGRVRVVAAMHKLLRLCFGVLKSGRPFDMALHQSTLTA